MLEEPYGSIRTSSTASASARGTFLLIAMAADVTHLLTVGNYEERRGEGRAGEGRVGVGVGVVVGVGVGVGVGVLVGGTSGGYGGGYVTHERLRTRGLRNVAAA